MGRSPPSEDSDFDVRKDTGSPVDRSGADHRSVSTDDFENTFVQQRKRIGTLIVDQNRDFRTDVAVMRRPSACAINTCLVRNVRIRKKV